MVDIKVSKIDEYQGARVQRSVVDIRKCVQQISRRLGTKANDLYLL